MQFVVLIALVGLAGAWRGKPLISRPCTITRTCSSSLTVRAASLEVKDNIAHALDPSFKISNDKDATTGAGKMKLGVLLLNLGGPENMDDVEGSPPLASHLLILMLLNLYLFSHHYNTNHYISNYTYQPHP